ncbi:MAG: hypothetical protein R2698_01745 [Microthrixaceae bacterium]
MGELAVRLAVLAVVVLIAAAISWRMGRRRPAVPTQPVTHGVPAQLDRNDFARPEAPWLVVTFSSTTCESCADVVKKASILESDQVAIDDVTFQDRPGLHERYHVTAAPTLVIADADGVVRESFVGSVSATHLWAALAELRDPGSVEGGACEEQPSRTERAT